MIQLASEHLVFSTGLQDKHLFKLDSPLQRWEQSRRLRGDTACGCLFRDLCPDAATNDSEMTYHVGTLSHIQNRFRGHGQTMKAFLLAMPFHGVLEPALLCA
eukprot:2484792-Amphidinium_carterae.1